MASKIIASAELADMKSQHKFMTLKELVFAIALIGSAVGVCVAWGTRLGPEYPAISAQIQKAIGPDLAKARITKWGFTDCRSSETYGANGDYFFCCPAKKASAQFCRRTRRGVSPLSSATTANIISTRPRWTRGATIATAWRRTPLSERNEMLSTHRQAVEERKLALANQERSLKNGTRRSDAGSCSLRLSLDAGSLRSQQRFFGVGL